MVTAQTFYTCEVCGYVYEHEEIALACENSKELDPCPVKVGQIVRVYERYDAPEKDEVVEIIIGPPWSASAARSWGNNPYGFLQRVGGKLHHRYLVKVKNTHRMSKDDDSYTDTVSLNNIMVNDKFLEGH